MWGRNWREEIWAQLDRPWDLIIVGGGITGAGILREAARLGLRALLVDQRDFGWGTSSRSSKLVHGGLRYLATGQLGLTWASVREREQLLQDGPGLIEPIGFLLATYKGDHPGRWTYAAGLSLYDLMAWRWSHRHYSADELRMLAPYIIQDRLGGGFRYEDAQTDDARLTLRVIREGVADGGVAINYVSASELLRENGEVVGVRLRDEVSGRAADAHARIVINATGAWADRLRGQIGAEAMIRPLRGSHLIFSSWRLPLAQAVSFLHPVDRRPVFAFPWEGVTLVGTTDLDHDTPLDIEPRISPEEVAYLMAAVEYQFPSRGLTLDDVIATLAGVRPVIGSGKDDPSKESREHVVWQEHGLLTVTGGKLTTFRLIALDVLKAARERLPDLPLPPDKQPVFAPVDQNLPQSVPLNQAMRRRLFGRYGADVPALIAAAQPGELAAIPGTLLSWAELRWAARDEGVVHLDDLLLRRVRLGLLLFKGGAALLSQIRVICQPELGWDDARWEAEVAAYHELWQDHYSLPERTAIPNWRAQRRETGIKPQEKTERHVLQWGGLFAGILLFFVWLRRRRDDVSAPA
jgi:glycerol-3-phosphate dehydrogenase